MEWARGEASRFAESPSVVAFQIVGVVAVPGDPDFSKQPDKNISLQFGFESLRECREWHDTLFPGLMESYARWHGPQPVFFATILKDL